MLYRGFFVFFSFSLLFLQGCVSLQSFSTAARAGDTITLAVGSAEGMTKGNTTLTYTPDSTGVPIQLPSGSLRAIVPLYPDKRTNAWSFSAATSIDEFAGHGGWLTVLVVDLPPSLSEYVGSGILNVETLATYSAFASNVNDENITLEILPGSGSPATFNYKGFSGATPTNGFLADVEVLPHYLLKADFVPVPLFSSPAWPAYGAIEIKVTGDITGAEGNIYTAMRVMLDDMEDNITSHTHMDWVRNGDTTTIYLVSPLGLVNYYQARVSILFNSPLVDYSSLPLITARYFDVNGLEVDGPEIKVKFVSN